ncbi:MAG: primosomal protein N' [Deltaproteobacteria bacterium]|nr:primosomal protein N' [Deltaproteobacteria bacterium]
MSEKPDRILRIAVTLPVKEAYSYSVPDSLLERAEIGCRVLAPFRNRKVTGYIIGIEEQDKEGVKGIRDIIDVLDDTPLFNVKMVPFFQWMADYYLFPIGLLIRSALPGGINATSRKTARLSEEGLKAISLSRIPPEEKELLLWIKNNPGRRLPGQRDALARLTGKGWAIVEDRTVKGTAGPLKKICIRIMDGIDLEAVLSGDKGRGPGNEREFLELFRASGTLPLSEITSRFKNGLYLANKWIKAGVLERRTETFIRNPSGGIIATTPEPSILFDQQANVLRHITGCLDKGAFSVCLLNGVTGSGKTEVYYRAARHALNQGKQAIIMVPEIALAVYTEGIFSSRFGDRMAVFHSGLSDGERYDQWLRMAGGKADIVIGARSALFSPLPRLGLIIVDEEYDWSYKQEDAPRYQARDSAVVRGRMEDTLVILGAGTPSVRSFRNASSGRYRLLSMPERIEKRPLPEVEIVDMKGIRDCGKSEEIISPQLRSALKDTLASGGQAMLFLNRRGFSRVYLCRSCGESMKCPNCDVTLIYHIRENSLNCHYCGFHMTPPDKCPSCRRGAMYAFGFGTQRLELELQRLLPLARIARMDRDSTKRKGETFRILKDFNEGKTDILVGTQMITKGYDFPNVTLVGVVSADLSLGFPDFRSGERTFQLLSQAAGRAGRGKRKGRVIIQTFNPGNYAIISARDHDYESFYLKETELREQLEYPPFSYLACLRFQGNDRAATEAMADRIGREIIAITAGWPKRGKDIRVLGPVEAPMARLKGKYRRQILIKGKGTSILHYLLKEIDALSREILRKSGVSMIIDVDPYQML